MAGEIANLQVRVGANIQDAQQGLARLSQEMTRTAATARATGQALAASGASGTSASAGIERVARATRDAARESGQASSITKELSSPGAALSLAGIRISHRARVSPVISQRVTVNDRSTAVR